MNQLASIYLSLQSQTNDNLTKVSGSVLRKVFLDSLEQVHPPLYDGLMQVQHEPKPFTISRLHRLRRKNDRTAYRWRITTLHLPLTTVTTNTLLSYWMTEGLYLDENVLSVCDVQIDEQVNTWTGTASFEDLVLSAPSHKKLTLQFASPTAFKKTGNHWIVLPEPERIFGSLLQRWNMFSPILLPDDLLGGLNEIMEIESYDLRTRSIQIEGGYTVKGFVGRATFQIHSDNALLIQYLNGLAQFAKYSGVGTRTAVGLGQVQQV